VSALLLFASSICAAQAQKLRPATVKNGTGHYRLTKDEFRNRLDVQQVAGGKIKFYLLALWVSHNNPDNIHNGELNGVVALQSGIALYDQDDCKLKFEFLSNRGSDYSTQRRRLRLWRQRHGGRDLPKAG
jgi:hypothetical protein